MKVDEEMCLLEGAEGKCSSLFRVGAGTEAAVWHCRATKELTECCGVVLVCVQELWAAFGERVPHRTGKTGGRESCLLML